MQALSRDVDGSLATIQGTLDPASLRKADGSGGPVRSRGGDGIGSVLRADWWMPEVGCNAPGSPVRGNHARYRARRVLA